VAKVAYILVCKIRYCFATANVNVVIAAVEQF